MSGTDERDEQWYIDHPTEGVGGGLLRFLQVRAVLKPDECMTIGPTGLWEPQKVDDALRRMLTGTEES